MLIVVDLRIFAAPQQGASYDDLLRLARVTEEAGYDGFFRTDHYLKMGLVSGLPGPTDAWITLAGLARETSRIRLGTLVTAATFRHPSVLAISVAQVDQMSGGRVELGLGAGWYDEEHRAYGLPLPEMRTRFDLYEEQLEIVVSLWETPEGQDYSFHGKHYRLANSPALPKPMQRPRPPIIIGGVGMNRTPALAARFADEFNLSFVSPNIARAQFDRVETAAIKIGRNPENITRSAALMTVVGHNTTDVERRCESIANSLGRDISDLLRNGVVGTPAAAVDKICAWRERSGVTRLYLQQFDVADFEQVELIASDVFPQLG